MLATGTDRVRCRPGELEASHYVHHVIAPVPVPSHPQGLISAREEFIRCTDAAFSGVSNLVKIVDDCLVHDVPFIEHLQHNRSVLVRALKHSICITFSEKKILFGAKNVPFCGYVVSDAGWTLDKSKTSAISDFLIPSNRTDLSSLFVLVNQCSASLIVCRYFALGFALS